VPHVGIPRLIRLRAAGTPSFDRIVTHAFPLEEINAAPGARRRGGAAGRVSIDL